MVSPVNIGLAAVPIVLVGVLLVGLLWPARRVMPIAWVAAVGVAGLAWGSPPRWLLAATIDGILIATQILFIIFGALVLFYTMLRVGAIDRLNRGFAEISDDPRVQAVLVGFFFATFIEGVAGFGTPAAVVAPLLLGLGFPALAAVIVALIGHIIAVTHGAVGTPIIVGIEEPVSGVDRLHQSLMTAGITPSEFALDVVLWAATYHVLVGVAMPLFAVSMLVYFFGSDRSLTAVRSVVPLCLLAGVSFAGPYWLAARFLTPEFPALVGSIVGGIIVVNVLQAGYLLPTDDWSFRPREQWPEYWIGAIDPEDINPHSRPEYTLSPLRAASPYLILIGTLLVTRLIRPVASFLQGERVTVGSVDLSLAVVSFSTDFGSITLGPLLFRWTDIVGTDLVGTIEFAYLPGWWLLVSALCAIPLLGMSRAQVIDAWREATRKLLSPLIPLLFVLAMVQVMLQSGAHTAEVQSMIVVLADAVAKALGPAYPAVAAAIGALGAALVGSNTVSNVTFTPLQFVAAETLSLSRTLIVGAQAVGGAIGNLVAIHNIIAALATVGLVGQEGRIIRLNLIPLVYYVSLVGLWTLLFVYFLFPDVF